MEDSEFDDTPVTTNDEDSKPEAEAKEPKKTKKKANPFLTALRDNQVAQAKEALMTTVCQQPEQTLGSVLDALEEDSEGDYIMLEIFKGLTIEELVMSAAPFVLPHKTVVPASDDFDEEDDEVDDPDDLDDDDAFDDDGSNEEDEAPAPKKKTKAKSKSKKKTSKKKAGKKAAPKKSAAKAGGGGDVDYQKAIMACLKANKARNADSGMSGPEIRDQVGGSDVEFRNAIKALREREKVDSAGKARGTKYFRAPRKSS